MELPVQLTDPTDPRLKHRLRPWDGAAADAVLIGVPFDLGVRLNNGREGAAQGPMALRQAILRYGTMYDGEADIDFDHLRLCDAGNIDVVADDVRATHDRLAAVVTQILDTGAVPVVIGGGNDASFASVQGLSSVFGDIGGVNIDAHLDVREVMDGRLSSGTPYRRILDELGLPGSRFVEFGLHGAVNSRAHIEWARAHDVRCWFLAKLREQGVAQVFSTELARISRGAKALFVSIDIDVFAGWVAPGVSAPGTEGLIAEEGRQLAFLAGRHKHCQLFELMELNPLYDQDSRTSRLAAMLLVSFLAGLATRKGKQ